MPASDRASPANGRPCPRWSVFSWPANGPRFSVRLGLTPYRHSHVALENRMVGKQAAERQRRSGLERTCQQSNDREGAGNQMFFHGGGRFLVGVHDAKQEASRLPPTAARGVGKAVRFRTARPPRKAGSVGIVGPCCEKSSRPRRITATRRYDCIPGFGWRKFSARHKEQDQLPGEASPCGAPHSSLPDSL